MHQLTIVVNEHHVSHLGLLLGLDELLRLLHLAVLDGHVCPISVHILSEAHLQRICLAVDGLNLCQWRCPNPLLLVILALIHAVVGRLLNTLNH